jgi:GNAT superfamily N-acetyltransferase
LVIFEAIFANFTNMQILPLSNSDLNLLPQIQPADWADIRLPIGFYLEANYCFPYKALIDNQLVGTGTATLHEKTGWLSTIITHPTYRNQGIGKKITEHLLAFLQKQNCDFIYLIATSLGEPVYSKVGFEAESRYNYYKDVALKELEISEYVIPYQSEFKESIFAIDRPISGENRWQHLEPFLGESFVFLENGAIEGAYFPSFGDGLIISKTERAGLELMNKRFQKFNMASIPEQNSMANNYMLSLGYEPITNHARMYFGKQMPWQPEGLFNRVGGKIG